MARNGKEGSANKSHHLNWTSVGGEKRYFPTCFASVGNDLRRGKDRATQTGR